MKRGPDPLLIVPRQPYRIHSAHRISLLVGRERVQCIVPLRVMGVLCTAEGYH